jgi:hypothetical protein
VQTWSRLGDALLRAPCIARFHKQLVDRVVKVYIVTKCPKGVPQCRESSGDFHRRASVRLVVLSHKAIKASERPYPEQTLYFLDRDVTLGSVRRHG